MPSFFSVRVLVSTVFLLLLNALFCWGPAVAAEKYKVLVVFSYEEDYLWQAEIREGIEATLGSVAEFRYFFMNTKKNLREGSLSGTAAYQLYLDYQPDGVIAADDNAQSMFVVPYLRNRVETPVMFCGVNGDPEHYGYPAQNVSGILERYHFEETIAFNRLFEPCIERFVFMVKDGPTGDMIELQLQREIRKQRLSAEMVAFLRPQTRRQAIAMAREYREKADLLIVETLQGVTDEAGRPLTDEDVMPAVFAAFDKPSAANISYVTRFGALASVVKSGVEQGRQAATMLLKAMRGVPVDQLPVTRNFSGLRIINVTTMKHLNIIPEPIALRGAQLVRSK